MSNFSNSQPFIAKFFPILSPKFPDFLHDYINTPALQRLAQTGASCGVNYSKLFNLRLFYTNLDHSVGVALIVWHFTRDRKATVAGLLHDIANPVFKHAVDFMNGDHEKQESTEERTEQIIKNSPELMKLLKRDHIKLSEVVDYKLYPIADNETPQLSADRLEYTLSCGYFYKPVWTLRDIKTIYDDITILQNEDGVDELGFKTLAIAEKFMDGASQLWPLWISAKNCLALQFIADTLAELHKLGQITVDDLYELSEAEVINRIKNCGQSKIATDFRKFQTATEYSTSETKVKNRRCVPVKAKKRYVIPLVQTATGAQRIDKLSQTAKQQITDYLSTKFPKYAYLDF